MVLRHGVDCCEYDPEEDEKRRALLAVSDWLLRLPSVPRLPRAVREHAVRLLRHYPSRYEIERFRMLGEDFPR